jgi:glycosyltransferase involved in cell wall biosynthesis
MASDLQILHGQAARPGELADPGLVSLIMAVYGPASELRLALGSLMAQSDRQFELIVVDQNPEDRLAALRDLMAEAGTVVTGLRLDRPNLSAARNRGIAAARGGIAAFPDDDCWYEAEVIEEVRRSFARNANLDGVIARWVEVDRASTRPAGPLTLEAWRRFRAGDAASITLFLKVDRLRALAGFDTRLGSGRWYGSSEDTDLVLRMLAHGCRLEYCPTIRVHHANRKMPPLTWAQCRRSRAYGRGIGAIYAKHRLSAWVIMRGLSGPLWHALHAPAPGAAFVLALCTIVGRIEGMCSWLLRERDREAGT